MKKTSILLFLLLTAFGAGSSVPASQNRVDSTGGLSLVLPDETADIHPYNFGNPAGLALLPQQNRFDFSLPWIQQNPASNQFASMQAYGALSRLTDNFGSNVLLTASSNSFQYEGLTLFPSPQWAFQAGGDLFHSTNQPDNQGITDQSQDRARALGRTALEFGSLSFGAQCQWAQYQINYQSGPLGGATLVSGGSSETVLLPAAGLLASFPLESGKNPATLRVGGSCALILSPLKENQNFSFDVLGTPLTANRVISADSYSSFGSEVYLEVPGSLQAALIDHVDATTLSTEYNSSNPSLIPSQASYKAESSGQNTFLGMAKWHFPVLISSHGVLSLRQGAYLLVGSGQTLNYDPAGNTSSTLNSNGIRAGLGTGLEMEKDFTVGLQMAFETSSGTLSASPVTFNISSFDYQIALGGEKWLARNWAYRVGVIFENDFNGGDLGDPRPFYTVPPGSRITSSTLTLGGGYKDSNFLADLRVWYGQPSVFDSPNPDDFATDIGVQLSASVLFP